MKDTSVMSEDKKANDPRSYSPTFEKAKELFPDIDPSEIVGEHKRHALTHFVASRPFAHHGFTSVEPYGAFGYATVAKMESCVECFSST